MWKSGKLMAEPRWKPGSSRVWHLAYLTTKLHSTVPEKAESSVRMMTRTMMVSLRVMTAAGVTNAKPHSKESPGIVLSHLPS